MNNEENLLQFPRKTAVFTPKLRDEIYSRVSDTGIEKKEDINKVIDTTEDAICYWLVCCARNIGRRAGKKLGIFVESKADSIVKSINS